MTRSFKNSYYHKILWIAALHCTYSGAWAGRYTVWGGVGMEDDNKKLHRFVGYFQGTLISQKWNGHISRDLSFALWPKTMFKIYNTINVKNKLCGSLISQLIAKIKGCENK